MESPKAFQPGISSLDHKPLLAEFGIVFGRSANLSSVVILPFRNIGFNTALTKFCPKNPAVVAFISQNCSGPGFITDSNPVNSSGSQIQIMDIPSSEFDRQGEAGSIHGCRHLGSGLFMLTGVTSSGSKLKTGD